VSFKNYRPCFETLSTGRISN